MLLCWKVMMILSGKGTVWPFRTWREEDRHSTHVSVYSAQCESISEGYWNCISLLGWWPEFILRYSAWHSCNQKLQNTIRRAVVKYFAGFKPFSHRWFPYFLALRITVPTSYFSGKFCSSFMLVAKSPWIRSSFIRPIMAQQMLIRKEKRFWSAKRVSQIRKTSGKGNSCERRRVSHRKA